MADAAHDLKTEQTGDDHLSRAAAMSGAERQRRYRERRAAGLRVVPVEVDLDLIDALIARDLIAPEDCENESALAFALGILLAQAAEGGTSA